MNAEQASKITNVEADPPGLKKRGQIYFRDHEYRLSTAITSNEKLIVTK